MLFHLTFPLTLISLPLFYKHTVPTSSTATSRSIVQRENSAKDLPGIHPVDDHLKVHDIKCCCHFFYYCFLLHSLKCCSPFSSFTLLPNWHRSMLCGVSRLWGQCRPVAGVQSQCSQLVLSHCSYHSAKCVFSASLNVSLMYM